MLPRLVLLLGFLLGGCSLTHRLFSDGPDGSNCVPYARSVSGIGLYGDAYQWWPLAEGHYPRGRQPKNGAVLVLAKTERLPHGHLAVVRNIVNDRLISVDHANWWPGEISEDMPVMDVSPANDWSVLRFWNDDAKAFGRPYPAIGFIYKKGNIQSAALCARDEP